VLGRAAQPRIEVLTHSRLRLVGVELDEPLGRLFEKTGIHSAVAFAQVH